MICQKHRNLNGSVVYMRFEGKMYNVFLLEGLDVIKNTWHRTRKDATAAFDSLKQAI